MSFTLAVIAFAIIMLTPSVETKRIAETRHTKWLMAALGLPFLAGTAFHSFEPETFEKVASSLYAVVSVLI